MPLLSRWTRSVGLPAAIVASLAAVAAMSRPAESPFAAESRAAVRSMMADMNIRPSADVDRDFAAMMIPHHQGAIDMAEAELRHGRNEQLRRIAQEIIVDQQQEIAAMHLALADESSAPASAPGEHADPESWTRAWASFLSAHICSRSVK